VPPRTCRYALFQADKLLVDGDQVGISTDVGYIANEHAFVSPATVDSSIRGRRREHLLAYYSKH
jgi:hypothetical protein